MAEIAQKAQLEEHHENSIVSEINTASKLRAVLSGVTDDDSNVVIADANGDVLTVMGINKSALAVSQITFHS